MKFSMYYAFAMSVRINPVSWRAPLMMYLHMSAISIYAVFIGF